jgi:hypothetical protein
VEPNRQINFGGALGKVSRGLQASEAFPKVLQRVIEARRF